MSRGVSYHGSYVAMDWYDESFFGHFLANEAYSELRVKLRKEATREAEIVKRALERTTATWDTKVFFKIDTHNYAEEFSHTVSTDNEIFRFVNDGTSVRYWVMTKDFQPKTTPRVIGSRAGQGGKAYFWSKGAPGIEPREFVDEIMDRREVQHQLNMERIFIRVVEKYWDRAFGF